jgi:hypothetical protein
MEMRYETEKAFELILYKFQMLHIADVLNSDISCSLMHLCWLVVTGLFLLLLQQLVSEHITLPSNFLN